MNDLAARVLAGLEDTRLEEHIAKLESQSGTGPFGCSGLSSNERQTLQACYVRLDMLTTPGLDPEKIKADPRLGLK